MEISAFRLDLLVYLIQFNIDRLVLFILNEWYEHDRIDFQIYTFSLNSSTFQFVYEGKQKFLQNSKPD